MTARLSLLAQYEIIGFGVPTTSLAAIRLWRELSMLADRLHEHRCPASTSNDALRYACAKGVDLDQFLAFLFSGTDDFHAHKTLVVRTVECGLYDWSVVPVIIETFLNLREGDVSLRPIHFFDIHLLRDLWREADAREVRPCNRCPQRQLEPGEVGHWAYWDHFAVDTYHFWNAKVSKRLTVRVEYYTRSMRCSEYFMETDYAVQSQHIHKLSIFADDACCIQPVPEKRGTDIILQLDTLSGVFPFFSRRELDKCQLVCRQWKDVVGRWSGTLALHDIVRVQEKMDENIMVHYAPLSPSQCCECVLIPITSLPCTIQEDEEHLDGDAYDRLKALVRNSFIRYVLHYQTLRNFLDLLEECAQEKRPLRVDKVLIYHADWTYISRCLDVAKKLDVQKYYLRNVMEHLSGDKILMDEGLRGAKAVELVFSNGTAGDAAAEESLIEFVFNSHGTLKLVLTFRFPYDTLPFSADALIQNFIDADDLSRMAATVDLEYHSQTPFARPRMCTRAAQENADLSMAGLRAGNTGGPIIECIGALVSPASIRSDIFHFYNNQCRQWLTCYVSSFADGRGFIRLARGKVEVELGSSE